MREAELKLFHSPSFDPNNANHVLAAFANRVLLEVPESAAASRVAATAVARHMRILMGVVDDIVITKAPSEPLLAVAAAQVLNRPGNDYNLAMETLLTKLVLDGIVLDRGLQGELCGWLLMVLARDKATFPEGGYFIPRDSTLPAVIPAVNLSQFLSTLLGNNFGLSDELDQTKLCNDLKHWADNVWLNFTHFVEIDTDISELMPKILCELWTHTCAVQCKFSQPVMDGFFVGYEGDIREPIILTKFVIIPYQMKARLTAAKKSVADGLTCPFIIQKDGSLSKPMHVALFLDLDAMSKFDRTRGPHSKLTFGKADTTGCKWRGYAEKKEDEVKRYCLNVRGHHKAQYPVIDGFEGLFDMMFQRVLACPHPEFQKYADEQQAATMVIKV